MQSGVITLINVNIINKESVGIVGKEININIVELSVLKGLFENLDWIYSMFNEKNDRKFSSTRFDNEQTTKARETMAKLMSFMSQLVDQDVISWLDAEKALFEAGLTSNGEFHMNGEVNDQELSSHEVNENLEQ